MKSLEVWVESSRAWRAIRAGADGQPRYVSNGALVGDGMRITRVSDQSTAPNEEPVNRPPIAGDMTFPEQSNG